MELTVSTLPDTISDIPSDLLPVLQVLSEVDGSFFILNESEKNFLQGAQISGKGFRLEYFEESIDGFYEYREPLSAAATADFAHRYLAGDTDWCAGEEWEHIVYENVEETGSLGYFDDFSLKLVISKLERNEIDIRVEPAEHGFIVYATPEQAPAARLLIAELFPH